MTDALPLANRPLAERLEETADLLADQAANPFRVRAYRAAATTVRELATPVHELVEREGSDALEALPGIGSSLAGAIEDLVFTGTTSLLERLRGGADDREHEPFTTIAGIGPELARRIHDELHVDTLEELELAAHDGRLARVPGMGARRVQAVREALAGRFRRGRTRPSRRASTRASEGPPPVSELLELDAEYRRKAEAGELRKIAPRRFNPEGETWLPVLHAAREERHYTVLYSNTARAHELGTTRDWVVIFRDDEGSRGQWTVVTEHAGPLAGKRVVRGREEECRGHFETVRSVES